MDVNTWHYYIRELINDNKKTANAFYKRIEVNGIEYTLNNYGSDALISEIIIDDYQMKRLHRIPTDEKNNKSKAYIFNILDEIVTTKTEYILNAQNLTLHSTCPINILTRSARCDAYRRMIQGLLPKIKRMVDSDNYYWNRYLKDIPNIQEYLKTN